MILKSVKNRGKMTNIDMGYRKISSWNRDIYQNLKKAVSSNAKPQIILSVCDDLGVRDRLVALLQTELTQLRNRLLTTPIKNPKLGLTHNRKQTDKNFPPLSSLYPPIITKELNIYDPHPLSQINQWLATNPIIRKKPKYPLPIFQILGVERLTRQPPEVQWLFLNNLRNIEPNLSDLDLSLLLWIPRPWLGTIQQSAPEFWRCHTVVFEFEGEPTPFVLEETKQAIENLEVIGQNFDKIKVYPLPPAPPPRKAKNAKNKVQKNTELLPRPPIPPPSKFKSNSVEKNPHSKPKYLNDFNAQIIHNQNVVEKPKFAVLVELLLAAISDNLDKQEEDRPENFLPLQILPYIQQQINDSESSPEKLAIAFKQLGDFYRDYLLAGELSQQNSTLAIYSYELLLELVISDGKSDFYSAISNLEKKSVISEFPILDGIINDLGSLYWMLSRQPAKETDGKTEALIPSLSQEGWEGFSDLEKAIALYQLAASKTDKKTQAETYIRVQKNLGMAYCDLARDREPAENLQRSVLAYQEAVLHSQPESNPQDYAATLNNLGTASWNLAQYGQPKQHLLRTISAYTEALRYARREEEPWNYGMLQNNLGTATWNLAQIESSEELLLKAIEAYKEALKYRKAEEMPAACAATNNNLGTAYWHLAVSDNHRDSDREIELLQKAIAAYTTAIKLGRQASNNQLTFDVFATHNNLGIAHYQLATKTSSLLDRGIRINHLEVALDNHLIADNGWQKRLAGPNIKQAHQAALGYIVKTIRAFYDEFGLEGQNLALSKLPGDLLPQIMRRL